MIMLVVSLTLGAILAIGLSSREAPPTLIEGIAALGVLILGFIAGLLNALCATKGCRTAETPSDKESN